MVTFIIVVLAVFFAAVFGLAFYIMYRAFSAIRRIGSGVETAFTKTRQRGNWG